MILEDVIRFKIIQFIISQKKIIECEQHVSKDLVFNYRL